mgnify:CR=1 FL=1
MNSKYRAVLVGCGGISDAWMKAAALHEHAELRGVVDLNPDAAKAFVARHDLTGAVHVGTDLAEAIDATSAQVVFDLTVPEAHCDVTCTALENGCHVLGEKPMAATMHQARRMVTAAKASGNIYAVTQTRRFIPQLQRLKQFLDSGAIGRVHSAHADFFISANFGGFRAEMKHVLLLDMAIHSFDTGRLLTPGLPVRVIADDWNPPGSWYENGASAWAAFTMDGGQRFTYRGSWTATGAQTSWDCAWRIFGDRGAVTWDGHDGFEAERVVDVNQPGSRHGGPLIRDLEAIDIPPINTEKCRATHDGAIHAFFQALRNGREPETTCYDNIHSLAMVLGAIDSAQRGGVPVDIESEAP